MQDPNNNPYEQEQTYEPYEQTYIPPSYNQASSSVPDQGSERGHDVLQQDTLYPTPSPSYTEPSQNVPVQELPPSSPSPRPRRRWALWLVLGIIVVLLILTPFVVYNVLTYINRSTPAKTLDSFCSALLREDYRVAYGQFSDNIQGQLPEGAFAAGLAQDKVISCTHGSPGETGNSVVTNLKLVHSSRGVNNDNVQLIKDKNSTWLINDFSRQQ